MRESNAQAPGREWRWTLVSGCITLLLALIAFFLPDIDWMPRGGIVGWLLLLAGLFEFAFGWKRGLDALGRAAAGSGLVTALAGLLFVANPLAGYFPVANVVTLWLFVRGAWVIAMSVRVSSRTLSPWLALSGSTDVLLGLALLSHLPAAVLVYIIFGPTRDIVARFALFLAGSFLVTGISQLAIAISERRRSKASESL